MADLANRMEYEERTPEMQAMQIPVMSVEFIAINVRYLDIEFDAVIKTPTVLVQRGEYDLKRRLVFQSSMLLMTADISLSCEMKIEARTAAVIKTMLTSIQHAKGRPFNRRMNWSRE